MKPPRLKPSRIPFLVATVVFFLASPALAQAPAGLSGIVKAELSFARVEGALAQATNRQTGRTYQAVTDARGYFAMAVEPGVYDLAVLGDEYISHFEGPIAVTPNSIPSLEVVLYNLDAVGSSLLIGTLFMPDGWPAADWTVEITDLDQGTVSWLMTNEIGDFSTTLGRTGVPLLLEFLNPGGDPAGSIELTTRDRGTRVLFTVGDGFRNIRGPSRIE